MTWEIKSHCVCCGKKIIPRASSTVHYKLNGNYCLNCTDRICRIVKVRGLLNTFQKTKAEINKSKKGAIRLIKKYNITNEEIRKSGEFETEFYSLHW